MDLNEIIKISLPPLLAFYLGRFSIKEYRLKNFAEIFVKPNKIDEDTWEFQIRNAGSSMVYLSKIEPEGELGLFFKWGFTRDKQLTLPVGEYYVFTIVNTLLSSKEVRLNIEFEDRLGKRYRSHHVAWLQGEKWVMQNTRAEEIKRNWIPWPSKHKR